MPDDVYRRRLAVEVGHARLAETPVGAMELPGIGSAYRTAKHELKHHGFATLFVELHNTIDNVSSGHSAMAIGHSMDGIARCRNPYAAGRNYCASRALPMPCAPACRRPSDKVHVKRNLRRELATHFGKSGARVAIEYIDHEESYAAAAEWSTSMPVSISDSTRRASF
jgi:hypothetical protein